MLQLHMLWKTLLHLVSFNRKPLIIFSHSLVPRLFGGGGKKALFPPSPREPGYEANSATEITLWIGYSVRPTITVADWTSLGSDLCQIINQTDLQNESYEYWSSLVFVHNGMVQQTQLHWYDRGNSSDLQISSTCIHELHNSPCSNPNSYTCIINCYAIQ